MTLRVVLLVGSFMMVALVAEIALRLVTTQPEEGCTPVVLGRIRLLPYKLDPATAEAKLDRVPKDIATGYVVPDKLLGWTIGPGRTAESYSSNPQGVRTTDSATFAAVRPQGRYRIVTVGDSFTHGDDVANDETWQHYLNESDPRYQVVNLGVGGYGTDQAFLRWRKRRDEFPAHAVILGIWPENICRNLNVDRFYLAGGCSSALKPRFYMNEQGKLTLLDAVSAPREQQVAALRTPDDSALMKHEYWRKPFTRHWSPLYASRLLQTVFSVSAMLQMKAARQAIYDDTDPAGNDLTVEIAKQFTAEVKASKALPVIMVLPMDVLLAQYGEDGSLPLVQKLRAAGLEVIDASPKMLAAAKTRGVDIDSLVRPRGHYSPEGNQVIAEVLHAYFADRLPKGTTE